MIQLDLYEIKNLCMHMAELGAAQYVRQTKPSADLISQREAYRMFSENRVKRWKQAGILTTIRKGETANSKLLYSLAELLTADKQEKLSAIINQPTRQRL